MGKEGDLQEKEGNSVLATRFESFFCSLGIAAGWLESGYRLKKNTLQDSILCRHLCRRL
jgi:hypothetical protein